MITGAAFCPHPPVLVPEVAQGAAGELAELRDACRAALLRVAPPGTAVLALGADVRTRAYDGSVRGSLAGHGVDLTLALGPGAADGNGLPELPLSLTVGAWLLRDALGADYRASAWGIGAEPAPIATTDGPTALLVLGDGSGRRTPAAPGYLDERAEAFDTDVAAALGSGEPYRLRIDRSLGAELLAAGPPAWNAAADLLAGRRWSAEVLYDAAPYGVGYFAAVWTPE